MENPHYNEARDLWCLLKIFTFQGKLRKKTWTGLNFNGATNGFRILLITVVSELRRLYYKQGWRLMGSRRSCRAWIRTSSLLGVSLIQAQSFTISRHRLFPIPFRLNNRRSPPQKGLILPRLSRETLNISSG